MATVAISAAKWSWAPPESYVRTSDSLDADLNLVERCLSGNETAWEDLVGQDRLELGPRRVALPEEPWAVGRYAAASRG